MKRSLGITVFIAILGMMVLPTVFVTNVSAQGSYTITNVGHSVEVMYSGHIAIIDTIRVSGQLSNEFLIGFPAKYGSHVLKAYAYSLNDTYTVNLNTPIDSQTYGATINFNGQPPVESFVVAFILSNDLVTQSNTNFQIDFPAYPIFTQSVGRLEGFVDLPSTPENITITKSDGQVNSSRYSISDLPAYTNVPALASLAMPKGAIQLLEIGNLNRQVTIDAAGIISSVDTYQITNIADIPLVDFLFSVPFAATNPVVKDSFGRVLTTEVTYPGSYQRVNASLSAPLISKQSITLTVQYTLGSVYEELFAVYSLDLTPFPDVNYYVQSATLTFKPPEGAKIVFPTQESLDETTSLTRQNYQDTLTVTRQGVSTVDYRAESTGGVLIYEYNSLWASLMPTFWALIIAVILVAVSVAWKKRETLFGFTKTSTVQPAKHSVVMAPVKNKVTSENLEEFVDAYDQKEETMSELERLEEKKNKIPRNQYKSKRQSLESHLNSLTTKINGLKDTLRTSNAVYAGLIRQLNSAEEKLASAQEKLKTLEAQKNRGEISLETYRNSQSEHQHKKEKAQSEINGILLRLREKI